MHTKLVAALAFLSLLAFGWGAAAVGPTSASSAPILLAKKSPSRKKSHKPKTKKLASSASRARSSAGRSRQAAPACKGAANPQVSSDGRFVYFTADYPNLVPNGNGATALYLHDVQTGQTVKVADGGPAGVLLRYAASADGGHAVYQTQDSSTGEFHYAVYDRNANRTTTIPTGAVQAQLTAENRHAGGGFFFGFVISLGISDDGRYVLIGGGPGGGGAGNLEAVHLLYDVPNSALLPVYPPSSFYPWGKPDTTVMTIRTPQGSLRVVSAASKYVLWDEATASHLNESGFYGSCAEVTPDLRVPAACPTTQALVPGDTNGTSDVYVFDPAQKAFVPASVRSDGKQATCG